MENPDFNIASSPVQFATSLRRRASGGVTFRARDSLLGQT